MLWHSTTHFWSEQRNWESALFFGNRVMGAIGIRPLSNRCARLLKSAQLLELQLLGRTMRGYMDSQARFCYVSGIVLRPELVGSRVEAPTGSKVAILPPEITQSSSPQAVPIRLIDDPPRSKTTADIVMS
jgi:hypothetical protein